MAAAKTSKAAAPATSAAPAAAVADYVVISPLDHDGERYEIGGTVALSEAQAKPLLGLAVQPQASDAQPEA